MGGNVMFCENCGTKVPDTAIYCPVCGAKIGAEGSYNGNIFKDYASVPTTSTKSKSTAILLGVFVGFLGAHNFYLGNTKKAMMQLGCSIIGLPGISFVWGISDIIKLYNDNNSKDANGNYLQK
jgi:TM2 domain-containing membrane protein YozV